MDYWRYADNKYWFERWREEWRREENLWLRLNCKDGVELHESDAPKFILGEAWPEFAKNQNWFQITDAERDTGIEAWNGKQDALQEDRYYSSLLEESVCLSQKIEDRYVFPRFPYRYLPWIVKRPPEMKQYSL